MGSTRRMVLRAVGGLGATGVAGAALAGCAAPGAGGGGAGEQAATSAGPVTVRYVNDTGTPTADAFNDELIKQVKQKYDGKINLQVEPHPDPLWDKRYEKYTAMALANVLPEVIWLCCQYIRPFMISGLTANLDPFIRKDWKQGDIDDFYKPQYEAFKIEGKQLGIPAYVNVNIMFFNRNLLKQAGLNPPPDDWSKQQFQDYAIKLTNRSAGVWGFDMSFTAADRNCTWIYNNGGEPHDPKDGPVVTKLTYDAPKTVEGLQFLHDQLWKHQVSPKSDADRGGVGRDAAFLAGKIAIMMDAASSTGGVLFNQAPAAGVDWDFMPLPKGPGGYGGRISTDGYLIDKNTKIGDQAWTVLKELTSAETSVIRGSVQRLQPPRRSAIASFEKGYEGKTARLARLMGETGRPDPRAFWKDAVQVEALLKKHLDASIGRNETPLAAAMTAAMQEIRGYYGS
jgi:multiple sugar transport system substrate-binding protein